MFLSVVIPAYNEEDNIEPIIKEVNYHISKSAIVTKSEIIVIDDHSSDNTFKVVNSLGLESVNCYRLSKRSGSHTVLRAGIALASGDAVLCISADGQDDPGVLEQMLTKLEEGKDIIWGVRNKRNEGFIDQWFSSAFYTFLKLMTKFENKKINLANADFYLLSRKVVNAITECKEVSTSLFGLIIWIGFEQDFVNYERRDRLSGSSKWNFKSSLKLAFDWITAFSGIPLKIISITGFVIATFGFLYAIFIIFYSLLGYAKPGWAEVVIIILILGGLQMLMLGILGEYLWRNLNETRKRPLYFIEKSTND